MIRGIFLRAFCVGLKYLSQSLHLVKIVAMRFVINDDLKLLKRIGLDLIALLWR